MHAVEWIGNLDAMLHYLSALPATGWDAQNDFLTWMSPAVAHVMAYVGQTICAGR
jgi:hypothetical protein